MEQTCTARCTDLAQNNGTELRCKDQARNNTELVENE